MARLRAASAGRKPLRHHGQELRCGLAFEREAAEEGARVVAGVDEVGRGALCGPVVAGAVVLGEGFDVSGIDDSKRLTRLQRERLAERIRCGARSWAIGAAEVAEIDRFNVLQATLLAMRRAVEALDVAPDYLLVDALTVPGLPQRQRPIVKGDALSVSIAAASVVAKVARDAMMREWDARLPGYGLGRNMGYASALHREALRRLGPSEIHRRTFQGTQPWLF